MALKKSPRGLIKPYTRVGVTSGLKKTAKEAARMRSAVELLKKQQTAVPVGDEAAEDIVVDVELLAMQLAASAKSSIKDLKKVRAKAAKYLAENVE